MNVNNYLKAEIYLNAQIAIDTYIVSGNFRGGLFEKFYRDFIEYAKANRKEVELPDSDLYVLESVLSPEYHSTYKNESVNNTLRKICTRLGPKYDYFISLYSDEAEQERQRRSGWW